MSIFNKVSDKILELGEYLQNKVQEDKFSPGAKNPQPYKPRITQVPKLKNWSLFKYLYKFDIEGLESISEDDRLYFTIPTGWEMDDTDVKYWFFTFPMNGTSDEVVEFYTNSLVGLLGDRGDPND